MDKLFIGQNKNIEEVKNQSEFYKNVYNLKQPEFSFIFLVYAHLKS